MVGRAIRDRFFYASRNKFSNMGFTFHLFVETLYSSMVGKEKVYGKLDLKDDIDEVIECIRQTIPIEVEKSDTSIYLSK